ncbi:unnamed protein product [Caenorhabditis auriculariae]|uniref:Amidophosphoribosyltransferase n=1 Tax=Caenorhabditis auriculariae TaxID=2777116 RepID=A0A8S1HWK9_9PELO|nr:unnamed protein product [Caenorhabditis auriculariae]
MCGIFGVIQAAGAASTSTLAISAINGLTALQHRGTESTGLVGSDGVDRNHVEILKGHGLVRDVFNDGNVAKFQNSKVLIGHNRYSTAGKKAAINCVQPFVVYTAVGIVAIAHNGELVDAKKKREEALHHGVGLSTDVDSELIAQMIAKAIALNHKCRRDDELGDISKELAVTMSAINMSYSLIVLTFDRIYAIRDPFGNRPLCVGTVYDSTGVATSYCASSESCALPSNAKLDFEVRPGEIVELSRDGIRSVCQMKPQSPLAMCIFEYVYFARNDSVIEGQQVQTVREECGRTMAEEDVIEADLVANVPDSSMSAAIGYASQSGIPYEPCLHRNSYVGRSFIQPNDEMRQSSINQKFGVLQKKVEGKRIILVDDSIVRGNTMRIIVRMLKEAGAAQVHLRIASPPVRFPCFMGINIPTRGELLAANKSIEEIREFVGADSVKYLSVDGLQKAVQKGIERNTTFDVGHCTACLTGDYPTQLEF